MHKKSNDKEILLPYKDLSISRHVITRFLVSDGIPPPLRFLLDFAIPPSPSDTVSNTSTPPKPKVDVNVTENVIFVCLKPKIWKITEEFIVGRIVFIVIHTISN